VDADKLPVEYGGTCTTPLNESDEELMMLTLTKRLNGELPTEEEDEEDEDDEVAQELADAMPFEGDDVSRLSPTSTGGRSRAMSASGTRSRAVSEVRCAHLSFFPLALLLPGYVY
jgi:hypothetical protein